MAVYKAVAGHQCVYCGMTADTKDHYPPRCTRTDGVTLPCCRLCNSLVGDRYPYSLADRMDYVKRRLASRYRRLLASPDWGEDELTDLGYSLSTRVLASCNRKAMVADMLAWDGLAYLASIDAEAIVGIPFEAG